MAHQGQRLAVRIHERTNAKAVPEFPFPVKYQAEPKATRRQQLAAWMTSPDNAYFAKSYVNRFWGYMFGVGIIDPIDDIRAGNPPTNPELLDSLTKDFVESGFNVRHLQQLIFNSRTYQLAVVDQSWNQDDKTNYSHAMPRRLPAERSTMRSSASPARRRKWAGPRRCPIRASICPAASWPRSAGRRATRPANANARPACKWGR